jgi:hypothetical protein
MADDPNRVGSKRFVPPALTVFGDLSTITQTIGMQGPYDGGMTGNAKGTQV